MVQPETDMAFDPVGAIAAAKEVHAMADDAMAKADRLLDKADTVVHAVQVRLDSLVHGILDRFSKCVIHIEITPPKAQATNPTPVE